MNKDKDTRDMADLAFGGSSAVSGDASVPAKLLMALADGYAENRHKLGAPEYNKTTALTRKALENAINCIANKARASQASLAKRGTEPSDVPLYAFEEWARTQPGFGTAGNAPDYRIGAVRTALTAWHAALASQASLAKRGTEPSRAIEIANDIKAAIVELAAGRNFPDLLEAVDSLAALAESAPSEKLSGAEASAGQIEEWRDKATDYDRLAGTARNRRRVLEEIAGSRPLTATPQQFADHLQRLAKKACEDYTFAGNDDASHAETVPHVPAGQSISKEAYDYFGFGPASMEGKNL